MRGVRRVHAHFACPPPLLSDTGTISSEDIVPVSDNLYEAVCAGRGLVNGQIATRRDCHSVVRWLPFEDDADNGPSSAPADEELAAFLCATIRKKDRCLTRKAGNHKSWSGNQHQYGEFGSGSIKLALTFGAVLLDVRVVVRPVGE